MFKNGLFGYFAMCLRVFRQRPNCLYYKKMTEHHRGSLLVIFGISDRKGFLQQIYNTLYIHKCAQNTECSVFFDTGLLGGFL